MMASTIIETVALLVDGIHRQGRYLSASNVAMCERTRCSVLLPLGERHGVTCNKI